MLSKVKKIFIEKRIAERILSNKFLNKIREVKGMRNIFRKLLNINTYFLIFLATKGDTVILVGAEPKGLATSMAILVGKQGRVIVIEPNTENLSKIKKELEKYSLNNITLIPEGAWNKREKLTLQLSTIPADGKIDVENIDHDIDMRKDKYYNTKEIEANRLDNILLRHNINNIDLSIIMVNGAELKVLEGMKKMLKKTSKIYVKAHAKMDGKPINTTVDKILSQNGFKTKLVGGGEAPISRKFVRSEDVYGWKIS